MVPAVLIRRLSYCEPARHRQQIAQGVAVEAATRALPGVSGSSRRGKYSAGFLDNHRPSSRAAHDERSGLGGTVRSEAGHERAAHAKHRRAVVAAGGESDARERLPTATTVSKTEDGDIWRRNILRKPILRFQDTPQCRCATARPTTRFPKRPHRVACPAGGCRRPPSSPNAADRGSSARHRRRRAHKVTDADRVFSPVPGRSPMRCTTTSAAVRPPSVTGAHASVPHDDVVLADVIAGASQRVAHAGEDDAELFLSALALSPSDTTSCTCGRRSP